MYEAIPANLGNILLKRFVIFVVLVVLVMCAIYLSQAVFVYPVPSVDTGDNFIEINKSTIILNS